jgi:hypothetical protein
VLPPYLPSDKADVHQFVGEHLLNKVAVPNITKNSQPHEFFLLYFQTILAVIVQKTNQYMQQDAQARNKPDMAYSQGKKCKVSVCISCNYSSEGS